ncbi:hypothetical protein FRC04_006156 [Tulasnella sp. 424]|nr:hypothetical protein FRC04_006156 [Tulasnella sp. 424]KAG8973002.1 hypothetical protein FRC05_009418 [Tulasnella sp. 425]
MDTRRRSRGFSLSLSISSNNGGPRTPSLLSRRQSTASVFLPSSSPSPAPATPGRFKRALKRIGSIRIPFTRRNSSSSTALNWGGAAMGDSDFMYDDDMDVSYEGLLRLAARIGDAKPKNLPQEYKAGLPRGVYATCEAARLEDSCAICLEKTWLDLASNCPVCRRELTPADYRFDPNAPPASPSSPISLTSYFGTLPPMSPIPPVVMEETTSRSDSESLVDNTPSSPSSSPTTPEEEQEHLPTVHYQSPI